MIVSTRVRASGDVYSQAEELLRRYRRAMGFGGRLSPYEYRRLLRDVRMLERAGLPLELRSRLQSLVNEARFAQLREQARRLVLWEEVRREEIRKLAVRSFLSRS